MDLFQHVCAFTACFRDCYLFIIRSTHLTFAKVFSGENKPSALALWYGFHVMFLHLEFMVILYVCVLEN